MNEHNGKPKRDGNQQLKAPALKTAPNPSAKWIPANDGQNVASANIVTGQIADLVPGIMATDDGAGADRDAQKDLGDGMIKMREQFSDQLSKANRNLLRLQNEFGKLHHMSLEFDELVGSLTGPHGYDVNDLNKIKDSMDSMDERVRGIASNQDNLTAMLMKMDLRMRQQQKADKLNFDSTAGALAKIDVLLARMVEANEPAAMAEKMQQHTDAALNAQTQQITTTIIVVVVLGIALCYTLFPTTL